MLRAYETGVVAALPAIFIATLLILLYTVCHGDVFWWRITESNCCENLAKVPGYHYINPPN